MDCEKVRELEGAYVLGALEPGETSALEGHLAECGEHTNIAELMAAAMLLSLAVPERRAPAGLRTRVLASAANANTSRAPRQIRRWVYGVAAASALLLLVAGVLSMAPSGGPQQSADTHVTEFVVSDVQVRFEASFATPHASVSLSGLSPSESYHLWVIRDQDWLSVGEFRANANGEWSGAFEFQVDPADAICLTVGSPGQATGPFGETVFIHPLS